MVALAGLLTVSLTVALPTFVIPNVYKPIGLEARVGIEPTDEAFAEPCLTTWLPRLQRTNKLNFFRTTSKFNRGSIRKSQLAPVWP